MLEIHTEDLNECETFQSMRDCDTVYGKCRNTEGGFECECKNGSVDVSSDVRNRPGRQCRGQSSSCLLINYVVIIAKLGWKIVLPAFTIKHFSTLGD